MQQQRSTNWLPGNATDFSDRVLQETPQRQRSQPWSQMEDELLVRLVESHGTKSWAKIVQFLGGRRSGKQVRERWYNHLDPTICRLAWSADEDESIMRLREKHGNRWSVIARHLVGRTDNAVKNRWYSHLRKVYEAQEAEKIRTIPGYTPPVIPSVGGGGGGNRNNHDNDSHHHHNNHHNHHHRSGNGMDHELQLRRVMEDVHDDELHSFQQAFMEAAAASAASTTATAEPVSGRKRQGGPKLQLSFEEITSAQQRNLGIDHQFFETLMQRSAQTGRDSTTPHTSHSNNNADAPMFDVVGTAPPPLGHLIFPAPPNPMMAAAAARAASGTLHALHQQQVTENSLHLASNLLNSNADSLWQEMDAIMAAATTTSSSSSNASSSNSSSSPSTTTTNNSNNSNNFANNNTNNGFCVPPPSKRRSITSPGTASTPFSSSLTSGLEALSTASTPFRGPETGGRNNNSAKDKDSIMADSGPIIASISEPAHHSWPDPLDYSTSTRVAAAAAALTNWQQKYQDLQQMQSALPTFEQLAKQGW